MTWGAPAHPPARRSSVVAVAALVVCVVALAGLAVVLVLLARPAHTEAEAAPAPIPEVATAGDADAPGPGDNGGAGDQEPTGEIPEFSFEELAEHPLLAEGVGLPNLACQVEADVDTRSQLEAHAAEVIDCLDQMWAPALRAASIAHRSPGLFVPVSIDDLSSPCGDGGADYLAFYCPTDESIYLPMDTLGRPPEVMPHYYAWIVAHEYGHHVQYLSGIGQASDEEERVRRYYSPAAREALRRLELQAECFAGMFLGSSDAAGNLDMSTHHHGFTEWVRGSGPSETHGSGEAQAAWWSDGYRDNRTASCNTYSAPAAEVAAE